MLRSSLALVLALVALPLGVDADAQSLPVQAGVSTPPSSFTLDATGGTLDRRDIPQLTAACHLTPGPSPIIRCDPSRFKTFDPDALAPGDRPFQLNPGQWSAKDWQDSGRNVAATSFSMHVAGNLATEDSTRLFLKGLGGEALAAKAPQIFEMIKSPAARYVALAGVVIGGTVYLYEGLWGGGSASSPPRSTAQNPTFHLLGSVSPTGSSAPSH